MSDEKGFYHCFSTGEHGNIFDFIMKTQSVGFGDAVKLLAVEAGMEIYRFQKGMKKEKKDFQLTKIFTQNIMKFPRETYLKKVIVLHLSI